MEKERAKNGGKRGRETREARKGRQRYTCIITLASDARRDEIKKKLYIYTVMFKFTDLKESYSNLLIGHSIEWVRFNYSVLIFLRRVDSYSNHFRPKKKKKTRKNELLFKHACRTFMRELKKKKDGDGLK